VDAKNDSSWGGWCSSEPVGAYGVGLGKTIMRGTEKFSRHTRFEVGECSKARSWHNLWSEDMALKEAFPSLNGITCATNASIADHAKLSKGFIKWKVSFAKSAHDWQVDVIASFFKVLYLGILRQEGKDKLRWTGGSLPKEGCLLSKFFTVSQVVMMVSIFLGKVFGGPRFR
jgi:hypothetical protein